MDPALVEALRRPEAYPWPVGEVGFLQTHISCLFFAGEHVLKVKKAVALDFLDYGVLERRRRFCEEEVRLNRALAPGVYLAVVPIARAPDGSIRVEGGGAVVEWGVKMARLPEERMLDRLLASADLPARWTETIARLLARFHDGAATGPGVDEHGSPEAVARKVLGNLRGLGPFVGETISSGLWNRLDRDARTFLGARRGLLERRVAAGRIREGHGDLHAGNICFARGGIVVYDRIEFSRDLRCDDVACDLAFLAMDLDFLGHPSASGEIAARYAEAARDPEIAALLPFYKGYRAAVRAKVAALASREPEFPAARAAGERAEARRYAQLAACYALPPALVMTCGLPGTGKSWLAVRLARPLRAEILRSDVVRKQAAGIPSERRVREAHGSGLYSEERTRETYRLLLDGAAAAVSSGRTAIVDASFPTRERRAAFIARASELGAPLVLVHVTAPEELARRRLAGRAGDASDADIGTYLRARAGFEPPDEVDSASRVDVVSCETSADGGVAAVLERLAGLCGGG